MDAPKHWWQCTDGKLDAIPVLKYIEGTPEAERYDSFEAN